MKYFIHFFIFSVAIILISNCAFADSNKSTFNLYNEKITLLIDQLDNVVVEVVDLRDTGALAAVWHDQSVGVGFEARATISFVQLAASL